MNSRFSGDFNFEPAIAYFSMEIGVDPEVPTYSGGLGVLAGDTLKACADLKLPVIGLSLLYKQGYFRQEITSKGDQAEHPVIWKPEDRLKLLPNKIVLNEIKGRDVLVQGWLYSYKSHSGDKVPIIFLDADIEGNAPEDRQLTSQLYSGDDEWRLKQEIILGIGGIKYLRALGVNNIQTYHMNEGHSALLTLELLRESKKTVLNTWDEDATWDIEKVKELCVFTTHTPVAAGHDAFPWELVERTLDMGINISVLKTIAGDKKLNMTTLGLNLSRFANGVAKMHGDVSQKMYPDYQIDFITNGIHTYTWAQEPFKILFDKYAPLWTKDPQYLRQAEMIPSKEIWNAHLECKKRLFKKIVDVTTRKLDPDILTIGFARRSATYKRATLLFKDIERLLSLSKNYNGIQLVFSGKSHPQDEGGKKYIKEIYTLAKELEQKSKTLKLVYIPDYNMRLGALITAGVDVWLNTPIPPHEASGTSGMKAALNGNPNLSIVDGWWVEGCVEGVTGWAIGDSVVSASLDGDQRDELDADSLYRKLEEVVIPTFYEKREEWIEIQRHSIAINASFFNTHRQMEQYVAKAYFNP